jgi:hypothetical protein
MFNNFKEEILRVYSQGNTSELHEALDLMDNVYEDTDFDGNEKTFIVGSVFFGDPS